MAIAHFSGTLAELRDIVERTPKIVEALSSGAKHDVANYLEAVQKSQQESSEDIQKSTTDLTVQVQQRTESLSEQIKRLDVLLNGMVHSLEQRKVVMPDNERAMR